MAAYNATSRDGGVAHFNSGAFTSDGTITVITLG